MADTIALLFTLGLLLIAFAAIAVITYYGIKIINGVLSFIKWILGGGLA